MTNLCGFFRKNLELNNRLSPRPLCFPVDSLALPCGKSTSSEFRHGASEVTSCGLALRQRSSIPA
jgi:hypothetical protein